MLCFAVVISCVHCKLMSSLYPHPSGLTHWHWGDHMAPAPGKIRWRIWFNGVAQSNSQSSINVFCYSFVLVTSRPKITIQNVLTLNFPKSSDMAVQLRPLLKRTDTLAAVSIRISERFDHFNTNSHGTGRHESWQKYALPLNRWRCRSPLVWRWSDGLYFATCIHIASECDTRTAIH